MGHLAAISHSNAGTGDGAMGVSQPTLVVVLGTGSSVLLRRPLVSPDKPIVATVARVTQVRECLQGGGAHRSRLRGAQWAALTVLQRLLADLHKGAYRLRSSSLRLSTGPTISSLSPLTEINLFHRIAALFYSPR